MTDEFNGETLDEAKWRPCVQGWAGRPPAPFAARNSEVRGGMLAITLRHEPVPTASAKLGFHDYTTGAVESTAQTLYGYFEIRAKAMPSSGASAFWLAAKTEQVWNEIDIAEISGRPPSGPRSLFTSLHVFRQGGRDFSLDNRSVKRLPFDLSQGFHVYGADWSARSIAFYLDGRLVRRVANTRWTSPAALILDAEIQADWFGMPKEADLPSVYLVDYVRVWKRAAEAR